MLREARREIKHPERAIRGVKRGFEDVGIFQIALFSAVAVGGTDNEASAVVFIEQG